MLIFQDSVFAGRGNPIMVIELDCGVDEELFYRNGINVREVPRVIDCVDDECPDGYVKTDNEVCECEVDCATLFADCESCMGEAIFWVTDQNANSEQVGYCGCQPPDQPEEFCGCPDWLTLVPEGGQFGNDICDIVEKPCFDGELMVISESVDCGNINNGMIQATIIIDLGMGNEGACVSIVELENCQLSGGEDFVIALAEQYEADAAFCAEDDETTIELDFLFDPDGPVPSWVWIDVTGMEMTQQLISPENLCLAPIPTLSTWMIIALGLVMAISGLLFVKRTEVRKVLGAMMLSF
jgi:hypothetical protein